MKSGNKFKINDLPCEIMDKVFGYLDFDDINSARASFKTDYFKKVIKYRTVENCIKNDNEPNLRWLIKIGKARIDDIFYFASLQDNVKYFIFAINLAKKIGFFDDNEERLSIQPGSNPCCKFHRIIYRSVNNSSINVIKWSFENIINDADMVTEYLAFNQNVNFINVNIETFEYLYSFFKKRFEEENEISEDLPNLSLTDTVDFPEADKLRISLKAVKANNLELLEHLVDKRNFSIPEEALQIAATFSNEKMLMYILDEDIGDPVDGMYYAGTNGKLKNLKLVYEYNLENIENYTELLYEILLQASQFGFYDIVEWLVKESITQDHENEALLRSVKGGHLDVAQLLIDTGSDVNSGDGEIMEAAVNEDDISIVEMLLLNDDLIKHPGLLDIACQNNNVKITKLLINHGYIFENFGETFDTCLIMGLPSDIIFYLYSIKEEDVEVTDYAFWETVVNERFHITDFLLKNGYKPEKLNMNCVQKLIEFNQFDLVLRAIDKDRLRRQNEEDEKYFKDCVEAMEFNVIYNTKDVNCIWFLKPLYIYILGIYIVLKSTWILINC